MVRCSFDEEVQNAIFHKWLAMSFGHLCNTLVALTIASDTSALPSESFSGWKRPQMPMTQSDFSSCHCCKPGAASPWPADLKMTLAPGMNPHENIRHIESYDKSWSYP